MTILQKILQWFTPKHLKHYEFDPEYIANTSASPDDRRDFMPVFATNVPYPELYEIPNRPSIRYQARLGSCASHAAVRAYETQLMQIGRYIEGSELFHYWIVRHEISGAGDVDSGMVLRDACTGLQKYGMALEYAWPYDSSKLNVQPTWVAYQFAHLYQISRYERLFALEDIKRSLAENVPVICGMHITSNFYNLSNAKYLWIPTGASVGGHAVCIVGYNDKTGKLIIDNSWGTNWGKAGSFEMSYDDFKKVSFDWFRILV